MTPGPQQPDHFLPSGEYSYKCGEDRVRIAPATPPDPSALPSAPKPPLMRNNPAFESLKLSPWHSGRSQGLNPPLRYRLDNKFTFRPLECKVSRSHAPEGIEGDAGAQGHAGSGLPRRTVGLLFPSGRVLRVGAITPLGSHTPPRPRLRFHWRPPQLRPRCSFRRR